MTYRILIVEDDEVIAEVVSNELSNWGYQVGKAEDFEQVIEDFKQMEPHLVLMDLALPFRSGFYWCAEIRKISRVPVLFLSSDSDDMSVVTALHQGADDYIAKPFDLHVLVAKVQAILRRSYDFAAEPEPLGYRGAVLDVSAAVLQYEGSKVELTRNELGILSLLLENKGRIVSRDIIMRKLWDDESFIDDNTLTVNINRLRKKLEEIQLHDYIETKKGLGYSIGQGEI